MEIKIDIKEIVGQVLTHYPLCAHLQSEFEHQLRQDYESIQKSVRVLGMGNIKEDSIQYAENCRNAYKDLLSPNLRANSSDELIERKMAEVELYLKFHEAIIENIETLYNVKKELVSAQPNHLPLQSLVQQDEKTSRLNLKRLLPLDKLEILIHVMKDNNPASLWSARWKKNELAHRLGTIRIDDYDLEHNQIVNAIDETIDDLSASELNEARRCVENLNLDNKKQQADNKNLNLQAFSEPKSIDAPGYQLPAEIETLRNELGNLSIEETSPAFVKQELLYQNERMRSILPEIQKIVESSTDCEDKNIVEMRIQELIIKEIPNYERTTKKLQLLAFYESEMKRLLKPLIDASENFIKKQEYGYNRQYSSLKYFLEHPDNGFIIPADSKEFLDWFLYVKHKDSDFIKITVSGLVPQAADFGAFHAWKKIQVENGIYNHKI